MYTPIPPPSPPHKISAAILILIFVAGLLAGGLLIFFVEYQQVSKMNSQVSLLQSQVSDLQGFQNATYQNITILQNGTSLTDLYANVRASVVLVQGDTSSGGVQGSGFVYNFAGRDVVLTNYHVVDGTTGLSVTFSDGHGFSASVLGTDPYSDLAVLSVSSDAPSSEFKPLTIVSSSALAVGEPVIAIGNPYGLVGSLTTGVVSATGRSITEDTAGGYAIANIIQTSTPINPGNSGGPLLNSLGNVVGITTAIVTDSQGLGFAIPSDTILKEVSALTTSGSYSGHSYLGVVGSDMDYTTAQQTHASVTYGWQISSITSGGPSDGKLQVNDIIIAMGIQSSNGTLTNQKTIRNNDDLASYLEEYTLPGNTLVLTVVRGNSQLDVTVVLGTRPAL
jgi:S1-C subfamily serine protease